MGLEKDIRQNSFRNDRQKAVINIIFTYNWMTEKIKNHLDKHDLTHQQFNILRILRGAGKPLSTMQIRERMLDKMSDTSRIVDRLVIKEVVEKSPCSFDRRLVDVVITKKGLDVLSKLDEFSPELDAVIGNLNTEETSMLNKLLDKIRE